MSHGPIDGSSLKGGGGFRGAGWAHAMLKELQRAKNAKPRSLIREAQGADTPMRPTGALPQPDKKKRKAQRKARKAQR